PHATALAVAGVPIPQCILPEVEVFLGEVPTAIYETPGTQKFADTIVPHLKASNTIILANHGTITFGPDLEKAYWNSEIIDAYCKILILARQLGNVSYFTEGQTKELLDLKKRLGYDDIRFHRGANCDLCGNNAFGRGYEEAEPACKCEAAAGKAGGNGHIAAAPDVEELVKVITDQVMAALAGARGGEPPSAADERGCRQGAGYVEDRLKALEADVARLKQLVEPAQAVPWWKQWAGAFLNDPYFEQAMKYGRQYRESLRPKKGRKSGRKRDDT